MANEVATDSEGKQRVELDQGTCTALEDLINDKSQLISVPAQGISGKSTETFQQLRSKRQQNF